MTFFYDLNKKLDEIRATPSKTHGQLNERDMGKHNNATTGFAALAKKAGKEYGSKAAGERVAGAQFQKMKKSGKIEEQGMDEAVRGLFYGDQGWQAPTNQAQRDATAKDVKQTRAKNRADTTVTGYGKRVEPQQGPESASGLARRTQPSYGGQETPVDSEKTHPYYSNPKHLDNYGNLQIKPGQGKGVAGGPNMAEAGMGDVVKKVGSAVKKAGSAVLNRLGHGDDQAMRKDLQRKMGLPQTGEKPQQVKEKMSPAKAKSFAALAPPTDKITFADKIAGAKKEVDEMLGDVAAEAIKGVLSPKQKKLDKNHNGKLDANDFAMLRRGGKKEVADEGWDEMEKDVKSRADSPRVGSITHGHKHDIEHTATGRKVTRRVDAQGNSVGSDTDAEGNTIEKRGRGRPKGPEKAPERVTGKATKHKGGRKMADEDFDPADRGEYDQEGEMAKDTIKTVVRHAQALEKILGDNNNLPEWVQSKLAKIESMMTAVDDYMQNQDSDQDDEMSVGEEKTSTRDNRAERAGKKVTKDIEYDEKKKDHIHGKKRGSEDARAEKAGKKVAKDIEYDEKKKKVKEQGGTDTPTASSGFSYGQGIYDSMNHELETMIRESMNVSMSMNTDANGGPSKSITVTATDDDALKLGELLKNAGLGGHNLPNVEGGADLDHPGAIEVNGTMDAEGAEALADQIRQAMGDHGHEHDGGEVCPDCGQEECGCDEVDEAYGDNAVSQNEPAYPTNTETSHDAFQYSGGLNKPKSSGMATIPVTDVQLDGEDKFASIARLREMAGIKEAKKPDFLDVDKDGDKAEPFKKAVDDKKAAGDKKVAEGLMAELARFKKA